MQITIVGATGVLGRSLIPMLTALAGRYDVRILARSPERAAALFGDTVEILKGDLLDADAEQNLGTLLRGSEAVLHLATAIPSDPNAPGAWDANTRLRTVGTRRLLDAALEAGARYYVQQSIVMAYPDMGDAWIDERVPFDPGRTVLLEMEGMVRALPDSVRWCILRGGIFVGRDTFQDGTIARLRAGQEPIPCDGQSYMPYVHVDDVARAVVAALDRTAQGVYNVADEPVRQGEYLERLASRVGAPAPRHDADAPCPPSQRVSSAAAQRDLGWTPVSGIYPASSV